MDFLLDALFELISQVVPTWSHPKSKKGYRIGCGILLFILLTFALLILTVSMFRGD